METYFAKAERASEQELIAEIEIIHNNPVISGLLHSISGLLAVLDEHRQIVALNDSFLKMLGIHDPSETLGLRPGEAVQCIHAHEDPSGCGTTKFCSSCGAAIAIVSSLGANKPVERICALEAYKGGKIIDIALSVRSHPIIIDGKRFLLLFLQDITLQQQRAALERTFFHDINNMLSALVGASEMLSLENKESFFAQAVQRSTLRLKNEINIQKSLLQNGPLTYHPLWHEIDPREIIEEVQSLFANHPLAINKKIRFEESFSATPIKTDTSLLLRVLCNMITNALEGTDDNHELKVWLEETSKSLTFCVWNHQAIPEDIGLRIFQRNFSTKEGDGRGIGTYSMKLFGEKILGGKVSFISSPEDGTLFRFSLPIGKRL